MATALHLAFIPEVTLAQSAEGLLTLQTRTTRLIVRHSTPGLQAMIQVLAGSGATQDALQALVLQTDDAEVLPRFYYYLNRFQAKGILRTTLLAAGQPLATLCPLVEARLPQPQRLTATARVVLSRFAYCRRVGQHWQLESPLAPARILLHGGRGAALVAALAQPQDRHSLAQAVPEISVDGSEMFLALLAQGGMRSTVDATGQSSEETQDTLGQWEFHDLLFHSRSRVGRHDNPWGGTYRFLDHFPPSRQSNLRCPAPYCRSIRQTSRRSKLPTVPSQTSSKPVARSGSTATRR